MKKKPQTLFFQIVRSAQPIHIFFCGSENFQGKILINSYTLGFRAELPQTGLCSTNCEQQLTPHHLLPNIWKAKWNTKLLRDVYSRI